MNDSNPSTPPGASVTGASSNPSPQRRSNDRVTQLNPSRKPVGREHGNSTRFIPGNLPALTQNAKDCIVRQWSVGIPIRLIARNQRLVQPQVEAVIWERFANLPVGPIPPTVRQSRGLHVVAGRIAA